MKERDLLPNQPLGEKLVKKWFWLYFFTYLAAPAAYFTRIIISNSVSVEDVGLLYSIISLITILSVYNDLWLTWALSYFLPNYRIKKKYNYVKTFIVWSIIVQSITTLLLIFWLLWGADYLANMYFHSPDIKNILQLFLFYFLGVNIFQIISTIFNAFQEVFHAQIIAFIRQWSIFIFTCIFFLIWEWNVFNYALSWIIGLFIALILWVLLFKKYYYNKLLGQWKIIIDKRESKKYLSYALLMLLWANATMLLTQIDQQMVVSLIWKAAAWYYANYMALYNMYLVIVWPIISYLFPLFTELVAKKYFDKISLLQRFLYTYIWVFALSIGALFVSLWPEIALIFFWEKFLISWWLLQLSWSFLLLPIFASIGFQILAWYGKISYNVTIVWSVWILNIIMNLLFIRFWWIWWVVISTIIGWFIMSILVTYFVNNIQNIKIDRHFFVRNTISIIILSILMFFIKDYLFILNNEYRVSNIIYLFLFWLVFYSLLLIINKERIYLIVEELKKMRT